MGELSGIAFAVFWVAVIALVIAWIVLPVAVIGTKPLLRKLIEEQQRTNRLLERGRAETATITQPRPPRT